MPCSTPIGVVNSNFNCRLASNGNMLITISGPSTIGKDKTWLRVAESLGFVREIPLTTRPMRPNERPGETYRFVPVDQFQEMIRRHRLTDWDYVLGNYYGTDVSLRARVTAGEKIVLQVLGRMAIRLKERLPNVTTVMLQTSDMATLADRLSMRHYTEAEVADRVAHAHEEYVHAPLFDVVIPDADILTDDAVLGTLRDIIGEP